jgi:hypothetical protein
LPNNPIALILKAYIVLLENKYKLFIDNLLKESTPISLDEFTDLLAQDFKLISTFLTTAAKPYISICEEK